MNKPQVERNLQPGKRLAFVQAGWHPEIVAQSRNAFLQHIQHAGLGGENVDIVEVPGSLEIPLRCQMLAKTGQYQVIIAAGFIVDGGIYRHDFVAAAVLNGMMRVQLETEIPILSIVLTPQHFNEQQERQQYFRDHFAIKGKEAAQACLQMLANQSPCFEIPEYLARE